MNTIQQTNAATIGQIVANNFRTAEVFRKYNIDFCCKGQRLLSDVCREKNLDIDVLQNELSEEDIRDNSSLPDFTAMELDALADYIEAEHHSYVRETIPVLLGYLLKINKVHGKNHPELNEMLMQFVSCADELTQHMHKEEVILFPSVKRLVKIDKASQTVNEPFFFGNFANPIGTMLQEHETEGERVARMTELSNNFTPPQDACTTYRVAYQKLEEFINDLYTHIHLENNILFPRTFALERKIVRVKQE